MSIVERYRDQIRGVIGCFDRIVIQGTLPQLCYADGMSKWLRRQGVRIFDYPKYAEPLRAQIRANAERLARDNGVEIEFVASSKARKESRVREVLDRRGTHPGLVHVISAMESCPSYRPWHDKSTHRTFLKFRTAKCLHYYFYFMDPVLGLCYVRVPTWCPFRLQIYFNGHNVLAHRLEQAGVGYRMIDNAFVDVDDFRAAQRLADGFDVRQLHRILDDYAMLCCPVIESLDMRYHWSLMQVEYATDIVFRKQENLAPLYAGIVRTAVHAVKAANVATFLGRKLVGQYRDELGNNFDTRITGTRIKHHMGPASIKMYDKFGLVLRIETTANDVSFFKHHRTVKHRDGTSSYQLAPVRKTFFSLSDLRGLLAAANRRYIDFISGLQDPAVGIKRLRKVVEPVVNSGRRYTGFNFFDAKDLLLFQAVAAGEHSISGFRNRDVRQRLSRLSPGQVSRLLKRLRIHGLIKRVGRTYKYYLTRLGRTVILTGLKVRELVVIPQLAEVAC